MHGSIKKVFAVTSVLFGIYYGTYSYAEKEHEKEISSLEKQINRLKNQVTKMEGKLTEGKFAWDKASYLQNTKVPETPNLFSPSSIWRSLLGEKVHSGKHIYEIQEILQENKSYLSGIKFEKLVLGKEVKFDNGKIEDNHYNKESDKPDYNLEFNESNFVNTWFNKSIISQINFKNSNFQKSQYDDTKIVASNFNNSNLADARINQTLFFKNILYNVNFNNATIIDSIFHECYLKNSSFDNSYFINSYFNAMPLVGIDFSTAHFIYDDDNVSKYFVGSIYNSKSITNLDVDHTNNTHEYKAAYCNTNKDRYDYETCYYALRITPCPLKDIRVNPNASIPATKFPENFDPQKNNLIDVSEFFDFLKQSAN